MQTAIGQSDLGRLDPPAKPLLRGYLHAGATALMIVGTIVLLVLSARDQLKQLSLLIYGLSCLVLFGMSALYHIITWERASERSCAASITPTSSC